jgi:predicted helicase
MITNHGYLDNPTFRGMRQSLLKTFDEIYILDLHGNSLKRETAPGGGADENVFDIRQGVAIGIFVKYGGSAAANNPSSVRVYHANLYGKRDDKYAWLDAHDLSTTGYQPITPESPSYFFTPRQTQNLQAYQSWPSVTQIFPVNSVGIVTARDNLTIRWTPDEMWTTVLTFSQLSEELARTAFQLGKDARDWKVSLAQQDVKREGGPHREKIVPILYRPFDVRYTYYTGRSRGFHCMPRAEVMRHMLAGQNLALIIPKQHKDEFGAMVSNVIGGHKTVAAFDINYYFPLYLSPSTESPEMFHQACQPNLADWLLPKLSAAYGFTPSPEEVLAYIYAVLYSPAYRETYAQELRTDFSRLPFTADGALFRQMAALGQQLMDLHLLRSTPLLVGGKGGVKYQGHGSDVVEKVRYDAATGRVHINADKYFEGITPEMWEYRIGGYQVLEKYLKDRKGRRLDDPVRYIHIASAIAETIRLQQQIDALYPQAEAQTI